MTSRRKSTPFKTGWKMGYKQTPIYSETRREISIAGLGNSAPLEKRRPNTGVSPAGAAESIKEALPGTFLRDLPFLPQLPFDSTIPTVLVDTFSTSAEDDLNNQLADLVDNLHALRADSSLEAKRHRSELEIEILAIHDLLRLMR